jgi:CheY-like chemotaxis protein
MTAKSPTILIDEEMQASFLPAHGVVNMRQFLQAGTEVWATTERLLAVVAGSPLSQVWFAPAIDGLRALAMEDRLNEKQAKAVIEATDRLAEVQGVGECYRTITALAVSPSAAPALLRYARRQLSENTNTSRWLGFSAIAELLKRGTIVFDKTDLNDIERAASAESDLRRRQMDEIVAKVRNVVNTAPEKRLAGLSILVVDDDEPLLKLWRRMLQTSGAEVVTATNVSDAIDRCREHEPSLLITDLAMPGETDGIDLLKHVRLHVRKEMPVIGVTGKEIASQTLQDAGFTRLLRKPLDPKKLPGIVAAEAEAHTKEADVIRSTAAVV